MTKLPILLLLVTPVAAQTLPIKPAPQVKVRLTCGRTDYACQAQYGRQSWVQPLLVKRRTADTRWDALTAASVGIAAADFENTLHALRVSGAEEANPLFGRHPDRLRLYSVGMAVTGVAAYAAWRTKREDEALQDAGLPPHRWFNRWWMADVIPIAAHAVGIGLTIANTGR